MILRLYLFSLYATVFISAGLFGMIVSNINPYKSPFWMILLFYFTIILFITALLSLVGFYLKVWATNREIIFAHLLPTLRQSLIIALTATGLIFFQQIRVLNWWVGGLFVVAAIFIEIYFRRDRKIQIR